MMKNKKICSVLNCRSRGIEKISFHRFPQNEVQRKKWLDRLSVSYYAESMRVCSNHFSKDAFIPHNSRQKKITLKSDALPRPVVLDEDNNLEDNNVADPGVKKPDDSKIAIYERTPETEFTVKGVFDHIMNEKMDVDDGVEFIDIDELEEHWFPALDDLETGEKTHHEKPIMCDAATQVNFYHSDQETQTDRFTVSQMLKTNGELNAFTGISSFTFLAALINNIMTLREHMNKEKGHFSLNTKERTLLTLIKLKLNLPYVCLAVLFQVSPNTCKNYFIRTLNELHFALSPIIRWPSKCEIRQNIPTCFSKYKDTRVVLDCTEIPIKRTKCLKCRLGTYSNYKGTHTLKFLLGVTPSGLISFVSDAFGGRASDKKIFVQSKILERMIPNSDSVMVDKGFMIDAECAAYRIRMIRPPFLRKKKQFSKAEAEATAQIAAARVHVERAIQRLKIFQILQGPLPQHLAKLGHQIIKVISGLVNLSRPILSADKFPQSKN